MPIKWDHPEAIKLRKQITDALAKEFAKDKMYDLGHKDPIKEKT